MNDLIAIPESRYDALVSFVRVEVSRLIGFAQSADLRKLPGDTNWEPWAETLVRIAGEVYEKQQEVLGEVS